LGQSFLTRRGFSIFFALPRSSSFDRVQGQLPLNQELAGKDFSRKMSPLGALLEDLLVQRVSRPGQSSVEIHPLQKNPIKTILKRQQIF